MVESESVIANLNVNVDLLAKISKDVAFAIIVTAKGDGSGFVSRFFAPNAWIIEDPVTGSAHCALILFWAERLGETKISARQLSPRGGSLLCEYLGDRVNISGCAVCYLEGNIRL